MCTDSRLHNEQTARSSRVLIATELFNIVLNEGTGSVVCSILFARSSRVAVVTELVVSGV